MPTQKEMIAQILQKQDKQGSLLTKMDVALRGPEYDEGDGGLIAEVHQNTKCIAAIKKKQHKIFTWGLTIVGAINIAVAVFVIIKGFGG